MGRKRKRMRELGMARITVARFIEIQIRRIRISIKTKRELMATFLFSNLFGSGERCEYGGGGDGTADSRGEIIPDRALNQTNKGNETKRWDCTVRLPA